MPYRFVLEKKKMPRSEDRRVKLTDEDREYVKKLYEVERLGVREIARIFEKQCSRRLIQFVLFPERLKTVRERQIKKKAWNLYYDTKKRREYARKHRAHKATVMGVKRNPNKSHRTKI